MIDELCRLDRVAQMLDAGVSPNAVDSEESRNTPLHFAACYGSTEVVNLLLGTYSGL